MYSGFCSLGPSAASACLSTAFSSLSLHSAEPSAARGTGAGTDAVRMLTTARPTARRLTAGLTTPWPGRIMAARHLAGEVHVFSAVACSRREMPVRICTMSRRVWSGIRP